MNWFDALVAFFLLVQTVNNARKGLTKTILEILSLFLSVFLAVLAFQKGGQLFRAVFFQVPELMAQIFSFTIIWLGCYLVLLALGDLATRFWRRTIFGKIDFLLGGVFGFIKGSVMIALVLLFLIVFSFFSVLPGFMDSSYRQSFCFRKTSGLLTQAVLYVNEWLLAEVGAAPSIFNQINSLMIEKEPWPSVPEKQLPNILAPLEDLRQHIKSIQDSKKDDQ